MTPGEADVCPLCQHGGQFAFCRDRRRDYWRCPHCGLVYVPPAQRLASHAEREEYLKHENSPDDAGYRRFLSRLFDPLNARLPVAASGLDFGCGPGPTLSVMFEEAGHSMAVFDPYFADDRRVLSQCYDFITATEVVEHLFQPGAVLTELWQQLVAGGYLGIMTKRVRDLEAFRQWHYKNDPTHVCFFAERSFHYLAGSLGAELQFPAPDVAILKKH